jgi:hypothetical protein
MILSQYKSILGLIIGALFLASCNRVTVVIEDIPNNTPIGEDLYIVGNFNNWNPGNETYQLKLNEDSTYSILLPAGYGNLQYKFTRGNWMSVEKSLCGEEIDNRSYDISEDITIINKIESWADLDPVDCPERTIKIDLLPGNTPEDAEIAIASELNSWDPNLESVARKDKKGDYYVTVRRPEGMEKMEFKVTRGILSASESDVFGRELPNRVLEFGKKDTLEISVEGWLDMPQDQPEQVVLILNSIPRVTPKEEPVFFASRLNSWKSGDNEFLFQINEKGQYYIILPRKKMLLDYKITRDGWHTVEVDEYGNDIENRNISLAKSDTVFIDVIRWKDQDLMSGEQITLMLEGIPLNTPIEDDIFITGNFNNWDPGRLRYRFKKHENGAFYVKIPRQKGDLEFKLTRGNWDQEAILNNDFSFPPLRYKYRKIDSIIVIPEILGWKDLPLNPDVKDITLVIDHLPEETPNNADIYFASNINGWNPENGQYKMEQLENGKYYITIPKSGEEFFEYKITRGGWRRVETDQFGDDIENRFQYFGFTDTVYINVVSWKDR